MAWMLVHPQIQNIFASLGVQQGNVYRVNEDCLAILDDILRKLSVEDCTLRSFRRAIGFGQHIRKDLVPLLIHVKDDARTKDATKIIDTIIKILVNLTVPVECLLSMDAMSKTDAGRHTIFEINKLLYSSKEAFVDSRSIKAVTDHMKFVIKRGDKLEMEQCDSINNCLLLLRNILHIPEPRTQISNCPLAHKSMQNWILWSLFTQSIDKLLLHLLTFPQKIYWVVTLVQLIALMYKDQHVGTLQKLLTAWFETSLSESSDDNESNTSPPPNQASGDSSPMLTSDPTTSDSSDNAGTNAVVKQHIVRSQQNRNKVLLTSHKQRHTDDSNSSTANNSVPETLNNKKDEQRASCVSVAAAFNSLRAQKRKFVNNRNEPMSTCSTTSNSHSDGSTSSNINTSNKSKDTKGVQSELSDYGYATQVENQESISTSSNDDDTPQQKPVHQKPHMVQKPRNKSRTMTPQDKKELRRKKLIKRSKINIINIKGLVHHSPTHEDISNILKEFTVDFLLKGYGSLVNELYIQLLSGAPIHVDTSHIFWLVTYFLKFATQLELELEHLDRVLNFHILAYLTYEGVQLSEQLEISCTSPHSLSDIKPNLRRIHLVVTAIKEFLQAIETYKKKPHLSKEHQDSLTKLQIQIASANNLKCLLLLLIRQYNPKIQSKQYLQDLIITNHILMLFLDNTTKMSEYSGENNMLEHLKHFANVEVMHQYGLLLEDFENNGKFINDCVFTMMHHIGGDIDNVSTLFQPNILKTFSKIWESDYEICDDWSDLIEYVIHKFINVPRQPTYTNPATNLGQNLDVIEECNPLIPPMENNDEWTEEEIDVLYWYYVQSRKCDNVVENIEKLYIENGVTNKTIKGIIQQLLDQNMIDQSCYEEYLKIENININRTNKVKQEEQELRDIKTLKEDLVKENNGHAILWLQQLLLEACHCKLLVNENKGQNGEFYEPVPYCYIKLHKSIPIVPWYKEHHSILKNKLFISLIHILGFHLPCDTTKLYIRIPHFWTAAHIYSVAQKLGPIDTTNLKFDENLLNKEDSVIPSTLDVGLLPENHFQSQEATASTSAPQSQFLLPHTSTSWFHTVLHSKLNTLVAKTPHGAQSSSEAVNLLVTAEKWHEVPSCTEPAKEVSVSEQEPEQAASEHISICETTSVTSDLTRMYVSDEEDKQ